MSDINRQLFEHYEGNNSNYASLVKMLLYATGSLERSFQIHERFQKEGKRLFAYYPGIDSISTAGMKPVGPIIDSYLYLIGCL